MAPLSLRLPSRRLRVKVNKYSTIIGGRAFGTRERIHQVIRNKTTDSLVAKADLAFEDACRKVIDRARASKTEIIIWRDGRIIELTPDEATRELEANLANRDSENAR
jgi:hypothetical protein